MRSFTSSLYQILAFAALTLPVAATNVVFIMADDLGYMDTGFNNPASFYETPNLNAFARQGMRFTAGYAACPVCSTTMKLFTLAAVAAILVFHSSCTTNCSSTPECWGGFQKDAMYITERPLLYGSMSLMDHFFWNGRSPGGGHRVEFSKYQRNPNSYPGVTLIPAGTTIACRKVQDCRSFEYSALEMLGEMLDGPLAGSRFYLTDLAQVPVKREISCRGIMVPYYKPNPAFVRIKESSNKPRLSTGHKLFNRISITPHPRP